MVNAIAKRQGFGNVLAEGAARAARKIGRGAEEFAMQTHGQEIPMHEPRLKAALGVDMPCRRRVPTTITTYTIPIMQKMSAG
jgi:aldehyde:ferredoxin oxidoreductase